MEHVGANQSRMLVFRHWLDVAEFIVAFSYAYDWLYNAWNTTERKVIRQSIIDLGLKKGLKAHESRAWFLSVNGNWNCKCAFVPTFFWKELTCLIWPNT